MNLIEVGSKENKFSRRGFYYRKNYCIGKAKTGGYITGREIHQISIDKFGIQCSLKTIYNGSVIFYWSTIVE
jgi:hypothetical protein